MRKPHTGEIMSHANRRPAGRTSKPATLLACLLLSSTLWADSTTPTMSARELASMPVAVTNNAVTAVTVANTQYLISFAGIGTGLAFSDTHARTFVLAGGSDQWLEHAPIPGGDGRLAATAASTGELAYVFGGYSVAADGAEVSTPWAHSFNPVSGVYKQLSPMPVPVDDAVSFSYENRFIYLISGWHDLGNVNLVQRYDTHSDTWAQATPIPGTALFGHAGAVVGNKIVYCDGVAIRAHEKASRSFVASDECWLGIIDKQDSRRIDWHGLNQHPGKARYRMAAAALPELNAVLFLGGSENPYNFNGIGYDKTPSEPARNALLLDLESYQWQVIRQDNRASMDHRGLVAFQGGWATAGGMLSEQAVSDTLILYLLR